MAYRTNFGKNLKSEWQINALEAFYHQDGKFYMVPTKFPVALCDPKGYVLFISKSEFEATSAISIGKRVNVRRRISRLHRYVQKK